MTNPSNALTDSDLVPFLVLFIAAGAFTLWAWMSRKRFKPNSNSQGSMGGGAMPRTGSLTLADVGEAFAHAPRRIAEVLAGTVMGVLWIGWLLLLVVGVVLVGIVALAVVVWAFRTLGL